jgi:hypothetical protein
MAKKSTCRFTFPCTDESKIVVKARSKRMAVNYAMLECLDKGKSLTPSKWGTSDFGLERISRTRGTGHKSHRERKLQERIRKMLRR